MLKTQHMFKLLKISKKTGLFDNVKEIYKKHASKSFKTKEEVAAAQQELGMDLMMTILSNLDLAEHEIYDLIADVEGKTVDEISTQEPTKTMESIKSILCDEGFKSFLTFFTK